MAHGAGYSLSNSLFTAEDAAKGISEDEPEVVATRIPSAGQANYATHPAPRQRVRRHVLHG